MNYELANLVMKTIEAEPAGWNQLSWVNVKVDQALNVCGTTACFAGHTLLVAGVARLDANEVVARLVDVATDREFVDVQDAASKLLGLNAVGTDAIFHNYTSDPVVLRETMEEVFAHPEVYSR